MLWLDWTLELSFAYSSSVKNTAEKTEVRKATPVLLNSSFAQPALQPEEVVCQFAEYRFSDDLQADAKSGSVEHRRKTRFWYVLQGHTRLVLSFILRNVPVIHAQWLYKLDSKNPRDIHDC